MHCRTFLSAAARVLCRKERAAEISGSFDATFPVNVSLSQESLLLVIFRHELGVVRVDVVLLHGELVQNDLQEVQRNDTDGKQNERGQLGKTEDHIQNGDNTDDGGGIRSCVPTWSM